MCNEINLLHIRGKNVGDYARKVLRIIFTREELLTSILPPGGSHYSRKPLDQEKFELFHGMYCSLCWSDYENRIRIVSIQFSYISVLKKTLTLIDFQSEHMNAQNNKKFIAIR